MKPYEKFREYCQRTPAWVLQRRNAVANAIGVQAEVLGNAIKRETGLTFRALQAKTTGRAMPKTILQRYQEFCRRHPNHNSVSAKEIAARLGVSTRSLRETLRRAGINGPNVLKNQHSKRQERHRRIAEYIADHHAAGKGVTVAEIARQFKVDISTARKDYLAVRGCLAVDDAENLALCPEKRQAPRIKGRIWVRFQRYTEEHPSWMEKTAATIAADLGVKPDSLCSAISSETGMGYTAYRMRAGWAKKKPLKEKAADPKPKRLPVVKPSQMKPLPTLRRRLPVSEYNQGRALAEKHPRYRLKRMDLTPEQERGVRDYYEGVI